MYSANPSIYSFIFGRANRHIGRYFFYLASQPSRPFHVSIKMVEQHVTFCLHGVPSEYVVG
ncbi:hypothetical protein E2562_028766, partial [Oryza meyeriana var. granulata]